MAKIVMLALVFTTMVAFSEVSAYTTTTITTIMEEAPRGSRSQSHGQCRRRIQGQQVNHCQMHITEGSSFQDDMFRRQQHLQLCCQQLQNVEQECQCEAINQAFEEAQRQQQGGRGWQEQGGRRREQEQRGGRRGGQGGRSWEQEQQGERRGWQGQQGQQGGRRWEQEQQGGRRGWQGQQGGQSRQQMLRRAQEIPNQCNLQVRQCRVQSRWF